MFIFRPIYANIPGTEYYVPRRTKLCVILVGITVAVLIGTWEATGENEIALRVRTNTKHESINATADKQMDTNIIAEVCSVLKGKRPSADKLSLSMDVLNTLACV